MKIYISIVILLLSFGFTQDSIIHDGIVREYYITYPSNSTEPRPLIIQNTKRIAKVNGNESVESITFRSGEELKVDGVFLYLTGSKPIIDFLAGALETTIESCLFVDDNFETSVAGVFAVGDILCREIKQVVVAASEGVIAALNADKYCRGRKKIKPDYN